MLRLVLFLLSLPAFAQDCVTVPTRFEEHRIFVEGKLKGKTFSFYTDSGGGLYPFVFRDKLEAMGMKIDYPKDDKVLVGFSTLPAELEKQNIPLYKEWAGNVKVFAAGDEIIDEPSFLKQIFKGAGFFGATFFADRIWYFNYPERKLELCKKSPAKGAMIPITFKSTKGVRDTHQPRMEIIIQGEKIPVLYDTGAMSLFTPEGMKATGISAPVTGSSFIRASVAERWLKKNPKWRVVTRGDKIGGGSNLIEVPEVTVAGWTVGPVWFAYRKDQVYDDYSRDIMDARIDGAVGGNLFKWFEITADYPAAKLYFHRP